MGDDIDDTWLTVFPTAFHPNISDDFDSSDVEDLHTVDNGVIQLPISSPS